MSDKKLLTINPDLFSFAGNTTRKRRDKREQTGTGIRMKSSSPKQKNDTMKKRSILKMIRQHQEDRYKKLFDDNKPTQTSIGGDNDNDNFNKEFKEAQLYLQNLTEKTEQTNKMKPHNGTIKQYPSQNQNSLLYHPTMDNIHTELPQWGCMKTGGTLPTYRNYMNKTQKTYGNGYNPNHSNNPTIIVGGQQNIPKLNLNNMTSVNSSSIMPTNIIGGNENKEHTSLMDKKINESINRVNEMKETASKLKQLKDKFRPKMMKQKRTTRRTYKIGKSKVFPRVSVLVSNKTIRNNISTKTQLLKQVPIQDVKQFLIKRGFIKVGSTAPNDVLRKMYESATLICGDVQNHNPDNLLYNFLNSDKM